MVRATLVLLLLLWSSIAHAEKRFALVIGNGAYANVPRLNNPTNDASVMETMFRAAGFDTVVRANDLGVTAMRRALRNFSDTAHDADIAVVFYAGHGIEVGGTNYLIPIDAVLEQDIDAPDEAVSLDRVGEILEPATRLRLIILDACRNNPFVRSMRRTLATRTVRSGYGEIDERSLPPNTLVAYAQRAGATAGDGEGANSPYTTALLRHLPTPGLDIELALRRVRDDVLKATRNKQEPFKYGSLGGAEIALVPTKGPQQAATPPNLAVDYDKEMENIFWNAVKDSKSKDLLQTYLDRYPSGHFAGLAKILTDQLGEAAEAWNKAKNMTSIDALEAFVIRYRETFYADLARARIEELKKPQVAMAVLPNAPSSVSPFDGVWTALTHGGPGCKNKRWRPTVSIEGKNIKMIGYRKTGRLAADGTFEFYIPGIEMDYAVVVGKLAGNSGAGRYKYKSGFCYGTMTLQRRQ
jgi:Caspase domain